MSLSGPQRFQHRVHHARVAQHAAMTEAATEWLGKRGYDEKFGARPLARVIQEHVKKPLAEEILFGQLKKGGVVKVDVDAADEERLDFEIIPGDRLKSEPKKGGGKTKKKEPVD